MKKILLWSLILIMGSCAVTKDKESDGGNGGGGSKDAFIKALGTLPILDSDGEILVSKKIGPLYYIVSDGGTLEDNRFILSKALSASQAIYQRNGVTGFIGLELDDGKAFIYKKGTVEVWDTKEEVDFDKPEHKLTSSAKGEFIILAKGFHFLDDENLELKADGHMYLGTDLRFSYVENATLPTTDTPSKKHAIYKKGDTEFMGIEVEVVVDIGMHKIQFYRPNKGDTYWPNADDVVFEDTHKFSPLDMFIEPAAGEYDIFDYKNNKLMFREDVELQAGTGSIISGADTLYTITSIKSASEAIYSSANKFIGVKLEVEGANKKLILYKFERKKEWNSRGDVSFDVDHSIIGKNYISDLIESPFSMDEYVLGKKKYNFKEGSVDLYIDDTLTYTYDQNYMNNENIVSTEDVIYKMAAENKYAGVRFNEDKNIIEYYLNGKKDEWDSPGDVTFSDAHKVPAGSNVWKILEKANLMSRDGAGWPSGILDNAGNLYVSFKDEMEGSVLRYDKDLQTWDKTHEKITSAGSPIKVNNMASDSAGNIYWVYHVENAENNLGIKRYDAGTESWENFAHAVGGTTDDATEFLNASGTGTDAVFGSDPYIIVDKNNNDDKYIIYRTTVVGEDGTVAVRKYNETSKKWEVLGSNGADFMTGQGMKRLAITSDGTLYAATIDAAHLGDTSKYVKVYKYDGSTWAAAADTKQRTAHIDLKFDVDDNLYLALRQLNGEAKAVKLNAGETAWENVGDSPAGRDSAGEFISLGFYSDKSPLMGTFGVGPKPAYVYKFSTPGGWGKIGTPPQAAEPVSHGNMAVGTDDSIYIIYVDKSVDGAGGISVKWHEYGN